MNIRLLTVSAFLMLLSGCSTVSIQDQHFISADSINTSFKVIEQANNIGKFSYSRTNTINNVLNHTLTTIKVFANGDNGFSVVEESICDNCNFKLMRRNGQNSETIIIDGERVIKGRFNIEEFYKTHRDYTDKLKEIIASYSDVTDDKQYCIDYYEVSGSRSRIQAGTLIACDIPQTKKPINNIQILTKS